MTFEQFLVGWALAHAVYLSVVVVRGLFRRGGL